ncbi:MAG: 7TM-DISM domain-containing protein, partial [Venatoribacter sp.]
MSVNYLLGGYFAILLVMGLYNLLLFFTQRERSYLYFVGFAFSFFLFHIEYESSALKAFWPDLPDLHNYGLPVFLAINMLSISLFVPVFLRLREQGSEVFRLFGVYSALAIVSVLMLPLMHHKTIVQIQSVLNLLIYVSAFVTGARYWLKGLGYTRFFSLAWAVAIVALTLINLRSREIIPTNQYTFYIYQIA